MMVEFYLGQLSLRGFEVLQFLERDRMKNIQDLIVIFNSEPCVLYCQNII